MVDSKLIKANEKIAENVTAGFGKMSDSVVSGFNKMTEGVVKGYTSIEDKFVGKFLTREGETVEEAKKRLTQNAADPRGIESSMTSENDNDTQENMEVSEGEK